NARPIVAELAQKLESVATRKRQIEQHEIDVRRNGECRARGGGIVSLEMFQGSIELAQRALQGDLDQWMVVDNQYLHRSSPRDVKMRRVYSGRRANVAQRRMTSTVGTDRFVRCRRQEARSFSPKMVKSMYWRRELIQNIGARLRYSIAFVAGEMLRARLYHSSQPPSPAGFADHVGARVHRRVRHRQSHRYPHQPAGRSTRSRPRDCCAWAR